MGPLKLPEQHKGALGQAQRILHDLLPQLDHLEACGEDCACIRQQVAETQEKIMKLLTFFSGNYVSESRRVNSGGLSN